MPRGRRRPLRWGAVLCTALAVALPLAGSAGAEDAPLPPPVVRKRSATPPAAAPAPVARPRAPAPPAPVAPTPAAARPAAPTPPAPAGTLAPPQVQVRRGRSPGEPSPRTMPPPRPTSPVAPQVAPGPREDIPFLPPERPAGPSAAEAQPGDFLFHVARPGGEIHRAVDGDPGAGRDVIVFLGTPQLSREGYVEDGAEVEPLLIKANTIVAWVDRAKFPEYGRITGREATAAAPSGPDRSSTSVVPAGLLGVYAEGAVELIFGDLVFRAEQLYIDPHTYKALLVEPRFDGRSIGVTEKLKGVEILLRARRARLVEKGFFVFDDFEVSTSRAEDHIVLQGDTITVEELNAALDETGAAKPEILGYQADSSQWYSARRLTMRGERLPLFWLPRADFGLSDKTEAIASPIKRIRTGRKSELGRFGFIRVGRPMGPAEDPWFDLFVEGGGYQKRGWAGGVDLMWNRVEPGQTVRSRGSVETWGVGDHRTFDSDGYVAGKDFRGRVVTESRTWFGAELQVDHEWHLFSDRGFNNEFYERDDLEHKDRESYVRGRWAPVRPGNLVMTLDAKWHQREFVTETTELPEVGLWVTGAPLLRPARRGGLAIDVTTETRAGYLGRRFDEDLPDLDYEAWRIHSDTRVYAAVDAGDVRLSGYVGGAAAVYARRDDGGKDLERTALLSGVRANLQSWRVFPVQGGWFELDGLRHVIDTDVELAGRFFDSHAPADVPYFDLHESERERSALVVRVRNRLQTRRRGRASDAPGGPPRSDLRTVADAEVAVRTFFDRRGPFGRTSSGDAALRFYGEPRPGLEVGGKVEVDFDRGLQAASAGVGLKTQLRGGPLAFYTGIQHVEDRSTSLSADASWRFSRRYAVSVLGIVDFDEGEDLTRILFRRYSDDHVIVFGLSLRNGTDVGLELSFEPAVGGRSTDEPKAFREEPDINPWGSLHR